ncbi:hypothetical protein J42TS3_33360 [Paenibacillus vini]|uniref:HTH lysR-type domain-containing protein n=1 Tax=Paenibacillus vini TaxID=1476024 RepID=A0ABQ4ME81_9BACL|nr:hypothetical protein J42TS3_33360 [Paenibacillus vini]
MDIKNLKTFHLIVKYGSFIRAAEEMNYAQSTVTMQMQRLESELGVELLERGKTIALTEAGRLFYEQSLQIMNRLEQLQSNLADIQSGEAGHVRLGVTEPTASYRLPRLLGRFQAIYPKIKLSVDIGSSLNMSEQIGIRPLFGPGSDNRSIFRAAVSRKVRCPSAREPCSDQPVNLGSGRFSGASLAYHIGHLPVPQKAGDGA